MTVLGALVVLLHLRRRNLDFFLEQNRIEYGLTGVCQFQTLFSTPVLYRRA